MASTQQAVAQTDPLDEQAFLSNEFVRSKALIQKLADKQHEMGLDKLRIEEVIMQKAENGEDDTEEWKQLKSLRTEINNLADEKLVIIQKIYALSQRFVQELNESISET